METEDLLRVVAYIREGDPGSALSGRIHSVEVPVRGEGWEPIAGLFVLAAPSWDEDHWNFDDLKVSRDIAEKLAVIPRIFFYHCRDDDVVPFTHLALHGAQIPQAVTRAIDGGGHQFDNDLTRVAMDIRGDDAA